MKVERLVLISEGRHPALSRRLMEDIKLISPTTTVEEGILRFSDPWDFEEVFSALFDFASSFEFDTEREEYLVHLTTGTHVLQICLFMLVESRHIPGKILQSSPPTGEKKASSLRIIDLDLSRYDKISTRFEKKLEDDLARLKSGIATRNRAFNLLMEEIERVALRTRSPILLLGPTGSGKSLLARRIFELKKQRGLVEGNLVEVNCATIRGEGAMSALFGHKRGAFTGAIQDRAGLLKTADRGLLVLDEIGELGLEEQAMLLRAIEEKRFLPLGADREESSDFQLIAVSNRDLAQEVGQGRFREDLFARINLWTYRLPALQQRPQDIEPNLDYELLRQEKSLGRRIEFSREARERYLAFAVSPEALWSANFRDLSASVTRLAALAAGGRVTLELVNKEIALLKERWWQAAAAEAQERLGNLFSGPQLEQIDLFDRLQLEGVVAVCRSSRTLSEAGRRLFAASRTRRKAPNDADRLRKYLSRFGLSWEAIRQG